MASIRPSLPNRFSFESHTLPSNCEPEFRTIITTLINNIELAAKIDEYIVQKKFPKYHFESRGVCGYPGSLYKGNYAMDVDVTFDAFNTKKVTKETDGGFSVLISAITSNQLPLKITLRGSPRIAEIKPQFLQSDIQQLKAGTWENVSNRAFDKAAKDIASALLKKREVIEYAYQSKENKQFLPFKYQSSIEFNYPESNSFGKFELFIEATDENHKQTIKINSDENSFEAVMNGETDQGVLLKITLKGSEQKVAVIPKYPESFAVEKSNGKETVVVTDRFFDTHVRDLCSSMLFKSQVLDYVNASMRRKQFFPFEHTFSNEFYYPGTNKYGDFNLRIVPTDGEEKQTISYTDKSFIACINAETDRGIPLRVTLRGFPNDVPHVFPSRHRIYLLEDIDN